MQARRPLPIRLHVHDRLERWRHRQSLRWPEFFSPTLTAVVDRSCASGTELTTLRAYQHRDHTLHLHVNDGSVVLCDGCGILLTLPSSVTGSSATTQSPRRHIAHTTVSADFLRCPDCRFLTPLSTVRRLLRLPPTGPAFPLDVGLALLVELVGPSAAKRAAPKHLHDWFCDPISRTRATDALYRTLGLCDEFLAISPNPQHPLLYSCPHAAAHTDVLLTTTLSHADIPSIPFSVSDLLPSPSSHIAALRTAAENAADRSGVLVSEAARIWKHHLDIRNPTRLASNLYRLNALNREFLVEQAKVRLYYHTTRWEPKVPVQATQSNQPSQNPSQQP